MTMMQTSGWTNEYLCASLVERLRAGKRVETREYLRPIFKWCKATGRYSNPEKAFAFVEWMVQLSREGDPAQQIPPQPHIQPNYALNTIITASQRTSAAHNALRAYVMVKDLGYQPDVFTYTALLDVVGRNIGFDRAWEIYEEMKVSKTAPNVVTYVTLIHLASRAKANPFQIAFSVLDDAESRMTTVDASIYNAMLIKCVRGRNLAALKQTLERMKAKASNWNRQTVDLLAKMHTKLHGQDTPPSESPFLRELEESELIPQALMEQVHHALLHPRAADKKYVGCLGPEASPSLRQEVIHHDMWKLVERFSRGGECVRTDFETIIHQCRKRKWSDQVAVILDFMQRLGTEGFPEYDVLPKPGLLPDIDTYRTAMTVYFSMDLPDDAWKLYQEVLQGDFSLDEDFICFVIQGCLECGRADLAAECYWNLRHDDRLPNRTMCEGLMRGLGRDAAMGLEILKDIISASKSLSPSVPAAEQHIFPPFDSDVLRHLALLLMESCAVLNNPAGADRVVRDMQELGVLEGPPTYSEAAVAACLMAAVANHDQSQAHELLFAWQENGVLPKLYILHVLAAEAIAASPAGSSQQERFKNLTSLPFKGFMKSGAVRHIDSRRSVLAMVCSRWAASAEMAGGEVGLLAWSDGDRHAIGGWLRFVVHPAALQAPNKQQTEQQDREEEEEEEEGSSYVDPLLDHYVVQTTRRAAAGNDDGDAVTSLLFVHYAHTRLLRVRDKSEKQVLIRHIESSVRVLAPAQQIQLLCCALRSLPHLELPSRHQSRLISFLAAGLAVTGEHSEGEGPTAQQFAAQIAQAVEDSRAPLEVVRDLTKMFKLNKHAESCAILGRITMQLLEGQSEKPIKITQFWANYKLKDHIPKRAALELLVARAADDNGHAAVWFIGHDELLARQFISRLVKLGATELATRLILRYDLQDDQQFRYLFDGADAANGADLDANDDAASSVAYLELQVPPENVVVVSTAEQVQEAAAVLLHPETQLIGLDAEWRPFATGSTFHRCSVLQLATEHHAFLFDLMALERWEERDCADAGTSVRPLTIAGFGELIKSVFENKAIVGYGIYNDLRMLWESYPDNHAYRCISAGIDLKDAAKQLSQQEIKGGLSGLAEHVLGRPLDKRMQRSDWQRRPLAPEQIRYAAVDALCLLQLIRALRERRLPLVPRRFAFVADTSA